MDGGSKCEGPVIQLALVSHTWIETLIHVVHFVITIVSLQTHSAAIEKRCLQSNVD